MVSMDSQSPNILIYPLTLSISILHSTVSNNGAGDSQALPPESRVVRRRRMLTTLDWAIASICGDEDRCFINAIFGKIRLEYKLESGGRLGRHDQRSCSAAIAGDYSSRILTFLSCRSSYKENSVPRRRRVETLPKAVKLRCIQQTYHRSEIELRRVPAQAAWAGRNTKVMWMFREGP
jgi:hypothetical protein